MKRIVMMSFAFVVCGAAPSFGQTSPPSPSCQEVSANVAEYIGKTVTFVGVPVQSRIRLKSDGKTETNRTYLCSDANDTIKDVVDNAFVGGFAFDFDAAAVDPATENSNTHRVTGVVTAVTGFSPRPNATTTEKMIPWLTKVQVSMP